jgi:hypothetical protein
MVGVELDVGFRTRFRMPVNPPLQGSAIATCVLTQGVALGCSIRPLQGHWEGAMVSEA